MLETCKAEPDTGKLCHSDSCSGLFASGDQKEQSGAARAACPPHGSVSLTESPASLG